MINLTRPLNTMASRPLSNVLVPIESKHMLRPKPLGGEQVRFKNTRKRKPNYTINVQKRLKKHGLEKWLSSKKGIITLWKKVLKGRHTLST